MHPYCSTNITMMVRRVQLCNKSDLGTISLMNVGVLHKYNSRLKIGYVEGSKVTFLSPFLLIVEPPAPPVPPFSPFSCPPLPLLGRPPPVLVFFLFVTSLPFCLSLRLYLETCVQKILLQSLMQQM